ncbi:nickel-dependent lactate racemase [Bryobacter aggregatus]|uniref:nickel-dependent lactate racemase n=1 Tax=Bryobacter aggregatus TaxID=360054 RepID=UPI0004E1AC96|nr:nickel-dependent lactate racemase [Bryobacter aggregatus]
MNVELAFGKAGLNAQLPDGFDYRLLEAKSAAPVADEKAALEAALEHPIGCLPLRELAAGKKTAAISVCDITRPVPNRRTLPVLLKVLEDAGIPKDGITICIATGLHRIATHAELDEILGPEIAASYKIFNHDAKILSDHRYLGATKSGIPIHIAEAFVSADLRITLGFIEPHLMLGFSGGRKLVAPGLAAQETIKVIHSPRFMRNRLSVEGSIEANPLHRELQEIARIAGQNFMLDVALTRKREIAGVFAGHPERAHEAGVEFVSQVMLERLDSPVDAVVTTCAGYPLDLTFYQAVKGVTAASHIVRDGGRILICAECTEGAGAPEFREMIQAFSSPQAFLDAVEHAPVQVDQWQLEKLALVLEKKQVLFLTPGVPEEYHKAMWGPVFRDFDSAMRALVEGLPANAKIAVIPEGPYVLARVEEPVAA